MIDRVAGGAETSPSKKTGQPWIANIGILGVPCRKAFIAAIYNRCHPERVRYYRTDQAAMEKPSHYAGARTIITFERCLKGYLVDASSNRPDFQIGFIGANLPELV